MVETEDMFLHRMRGIVRLYAAIISSPQLPVEHTLPHPHGLEHGWAWLTRVLNMQPHPTLTAAALGDFLEVRYTLTCCTSHSDCSCSGGLLRGEIYINMLHIVRVCCGVMLLVCPFAISLSNNLKSLAMSVNLAVVIYVN